jgi:hypothetical protein
VMHVLVTGNLTQLFQRRHGVIHVASRIFSTVCTSYVPWYEKRRHLIIWIQLHLTPGRCQRDSRVCSTSRHICPWQYRTPVFRLRPAPRTERLVVSCRCKAFGLRTKTSALLSKLKFRLFPVTLTTEITTAGSSKSTNFDVGSGCRKSIGILDAHLGHNTASKNSCGECIRHFGYF